MHNSESLFLIIIIFPIKYIFNFFWHYDTDQHFYMCGCIALAAQSLKS